MFQAGPGQKTTAWPVFLPELFDELFAVLSCCIFFRLCLTDQRIGYIIRVNETPIDISCAVISAAITL